jgi:hypothetical protein
MATREASRRSNAARSALPGDAAIALRATISLAAILDPS